MPSKFSIGDYEYSTLGGKYYRSKIGQTFAKEISRSTYKKYLRQYSGTPGTARRVSPPPKLSESWKRQLFSKSQFGHSPWNNDGNRLHDHLKPLSISDKNTNYSRIKTDAGRTHSSWGAKLSNGKYKGSVFVLNGIQEWMTQLRIAKHQLSVQAENFRIVVGQRALRVFQLSFKYHKFYNEDTAWKALSPYTRAKRKLLGTWFGEQKSKLYETGALAGSLKNAGESGIMRITTGKATVHRTRISSKDIVRGIPVRNREKYTTDYVYAGIHNEGVPKGRKKLGKVPKRQFMGWSNLRSKSMDKVDSFAYEIADRYLFDSVFLDRKR